MMRRVNSISLVWQVLLVLTGHGLMSGQAMACTKLESFDVSVVPEDGIGSRVKFNPFSPKRSTVIISATFDQRCDADPMATLNWSGKSATSGNVPTFQLEQQGSRVFVNDDRHLESGNNPGFSLPVRFKRAQTGTTATATLVASPLFQLHDATALFSGMGMLELTVDFSEALSFRLNHRFNLGVETSVVRKMSLSDGFGKRAGRVATESVDLGVVTDAGATVVKNLWVWSNSPSIIEASSDSNWQLQRIGGNDNDLNKLDFSVTLGSGSIEDVLGPRIGSVRVTEEIRETSVGGDRYRIIVSVAGADALEKRAGDYTGSVTLTILPKR